jgi:hypothetical protein
MRNEENTQGYIEADCFLNVFVLLFFSKILVGVQITCIVAVHKISFLFWSFFLFLELIARRKSMTLYDSSLKKFIMSAQVTERVGGLELLKKRWTFFFGYDFQFCQKSVYDRLPIQRTFYFGWSKFCWSSTLVKLLIKFVDSIVDQIVDQALNVFFLGWPGSTHLTRDPITWPGQWPGWVSKLWVIQLHDLVHIFFFLVIIILKISRHWFSIFFKNNNLILLFEKNKKMRGPKLKAWWNGSSLKTNCVSAFKLRILSKIIFDPFNLRIIWFGFRFYFIYI